MEKTGLVLGGGGAKGSYEVGVWMALRDLEIEPEIQGVSGTSIGALNTALYAQGDLQQAISLWTGLTKEDIVHIDIPKIGLAFTTALVAYMQPEKISALTRYFKPEMLFKTGVLSQDWIQEIIAQSVNPLKLLMSPLELFVCCCRVTNLKAEYFPLKVIDGTYKSILLASAAIPGFFDAVKLNGHYYYDGGLRDNLPIQPLYDNGYRRIIAVNLDLSEKINFSRFPQANLYVLTPQQRELFQGGISKILAFDPETNFLRICSGYRDAIRLLADFPAQCRSNLYEQRSSFLTAQINQTLHLKNGLNLMIQEAVIRMVGDKPHVFLNVITQMAENSPLGDSCLMLANVLILAFPDGTRSYVNLNVKEDHMYDFPLQLTKGQYIKGYMAFPLPEHIQNFSLIIMDMYNSASIGSSYFLDFSLVE